MTHPPESNDILKTRESQSMPSSVPGSEQDRKGKKQHRPGVWTILAVIAVACSNTWMIQRFRMNKAEAYLMPRDMSPSGIFWISGQHDSEAIAMEWWTAQDRHWVKYEDKVLPMHPSLERALSYLIFDISHTPPTEQNKTLEPHAILTIHPEKFYSGTRKEVYFAFDMPLPYAFTPSWQIPLDEDWFFFLKSFRSNLQDMYTSSWTNIDLSSLESLEVEHKGNTLRLKQVAGRWILESPEKRILKDPLLVEQLINQVTSFVPTHWQSKDTDLGEHPYRLTLTRHPADQHTFEWNEGAAHAKITERSGEKLHSFFVDLQQNPKHPLDSLLRVALQR